MPERRQSPQSSAPLAVQFKKVKLNKGQSRSLSCHKVLCDWPLSNILLCIFCQIICLCSKALIICPPSAFQLYSPSQSDLSGHAETNMNHTHVHKYMQAHERVRSMLIPATLSAGVPLMILHWRGVRPLPPPSPPPPAHIWLMTSDLASGDLTGVSETNIQLCDRSRVFRGQRSHRHQRSCVWYLAGSFWWFLSRNWRQQGAAAITVNSLQVKVQVQAPRDSKCQPCRRLQEQDTVFPVCCSVAELCPYGEGRSKV